MRLIFLRVLRNVRARGGPRTRSVLLYALVLLVLADLVLTALSILTQVSIQKPCEQQIRRFCPDYNKTLPSTWWPKCNFRDVVDKDSGLKECFHNPNDRDPARISPFQQKCLDSYESTLISVGIFPLASVMAPIFGLLALLFPETRGLRSYAQWVLLSVVNTCIALGALVKFSGEEYKGHYQECNKDVEVLVSYPVLCLLAKVLQLALVNQYIAHMEVQRRLPGGRRAAVHTRFHHQR